MIKIVFKTRKLLVDLVTCHYMHLVKVEEKGEHECHHHHRLTLEVWTLQQLCSKLHGPPLPRFDLSISESLDIMLEKVNLLEWTGPDLASTARRTG